VGRAWVGGRAQDLQQRTLAERHLQRFIREARRFPLKQAMIPYGGKAQLAHPGPVLNHLSQQRWQVLDVHWLELKGKPVIWEKVVEGLLDHWLDYNGDAQHRKRNE
jgi:hypothetical protein